MTNQTLLETEGRTLQASSRTGRTHPSDYSELIRRLNETVPATLSFIATTFPRGELQIMQPAEGNSGVLREYAREFQFEDRVVWQALTRGQVERSNDVWEDAAAFEETRFYSSFLRPAGLAYVMAAPVRSPVLDGFPGVLWVARSREMGEFTDAERRALSELVDEFNRARRPHEAGNAEHAPWAHRLPHRFFIFDRQLEQIFPPTADDALDARLREELRQAARERMEKINGEMTASERVSLFHSRGDLWTFRAVAYKRFPAFGDGPVVVLALHPECTDWSTVKPSDFAGDLELSRLIPAALFMRQEFRRGPKLEEIARTVHLSPFHFHRRFSELFGQTPKEFMLECQIYAAKQELAAREKDLSRIATDCGFAHQSHFTSRFKQATGLTPTRWRRIATEGR